MLKNKQTKIILLCFLISLAFSQTAVSVELSGSSCPKIGKVTIDSGKKYFCVLRNGSLKWNKGINWRAPLLNSNQNSTKIDTNNSEVLQSSNVESSSASTNKIKIDNRETGLLIWSDEFNSNLLDLKTWTARYCRHSASNGGGTCHNNESQYFLPEAITFDGSGSAIINTKYITSKPSLGSCLGDKCFFTSGRFDTQAKISFLYGYIEARIKMPVGSGNWPAFWMLGTNIISIGWPNSGEIDIAEGFGNAKTRASSAIHYSTTESGCCENHLFDHIRYDVGQDYSADFHTYGVLWLPNEISFYVDRKVILRTSSATIRSKIWPFNKPNFIIFNNAVTYGEGFGGAWNGWQTSQMSIDYVRQYKFEGQGEYFLR